MAPEPFKDAGVGSHFPVLAAAVARTHGPVLECGMGYWSTPMLHMMCQDHDAGTGFYDRHIWSLETDLDWMIKFSHLQSKTHHHFHVLQAKWLDALSNPRIDINPWSVAFIDNAPGESRVEIISALKDKAHFIVAHDTEADIPPSGGNYGWKKLEGLFKYETIFKDFRPWTTVYSDVEEFKL